jgi:GNAT superfamily N-acetyltransferase
MQTTTKSADGEVATVPFRAATTKLRNGESIRIRALRPDDKDEVQRLIDEMSSESRYMRFLGNRRLNAKDLAYITEIDFNQHVAVIAEAMSEGRWLPVALGEFVRDKDNPAAAEIALAVADTYQGLGLGAALLEHLTKVACTIGVHHFHALALADNQRLQHFIEKMGIHVSRVHESEGTISLSVAF